MKNLTDQELDSVFKNAAEGYEPAFDQAAWDSMKAKLDQPAPTFWKRWMSFAFFGLMIFSGGIWVGTYINSVRSPNPLTINANGERLTQSEKNTTFADQDKKKQTTTQQDPSPSQHSAVSKPPAIGSLLTLHQENTEEGNTSNTNQHLDFTKESGTVIKIADTDHHMIDETAFTSRENKQVVAREDLMTDPLPDSSQSKLIEVIEDTTQSVAEEKSNANKKDDHSFYLRLLASPDVSSISHGSATTTGSNYALLFEYQLTTRWSISSGTILSMKRYATDNEFTYGKYTADRMAGACRVLDIPINIYYRFRPQQKTSFYGSIGLSSYVMLEEDYTYTFDSPTGSRDFTSNISGENNEWFKMLNISFGVQYHVAPRFHLQVEPFIKAPLAGVGEWDVKLSSMGVFMGLKYKIN